MKRLLCLAALAAGLLGHSFSAQAAGVEFSVGQTSDSTQAYRLGMQWDWDKSWLQSDVGRLTGYWSGAYTYWDGDKTSSNHSLSFSPVLVYEFAGASVKPYIEAGIGVAAFAHTEVEDNKLGSSFQFEDRIGFGLRFAGGHEVGVRATHYSNAGIQTPNDGIESYALHYTMPL
ncbi:MULTISPECIES: acyloxyacyl hydrolase [Pseudomonas]|uniref:Lipid A deacylase n=1 Tax=Pseudomonas protegens TaxID=380021 RepID=A0A7G8YJ80_9PSED|nr:MULTISPECIES: acyloxyacyl hydrolase [Pseudomonas]RBJ78061.1 acyloxyacyl hydrolase [Pseudomonas sp. MWU12-2534b]MCO7572251.1 acyloxyacyl hydrolase [Pseudomonas chlororaphis]MCO7589899.1 acyloxyacyl hydrolase [Pseudomonas chlororaphis]MCO7612499.1 acyloxyacyl hydrolase [Pseudomonas chlororaphis]MDF2399251.1 acyloxyacyl hydrolase [Pseudomonas sp. 3MA1]